MTISPDPDQRSPKETAELRDKMLRRMLKTPPKPHKEQGKTKQESSGNRRTK